MSGPQSFWAYYDLGLMALQEDNCPAAAAALAWALNIPVQAAAGEIYASKLYLDARGDAPDFDRMLQEHLKAAYLDAYQLVGLADRCAKGGLDERQRQETRAAAARASVWIF